jgi:exonuclease III
LASWNVRTLQDHDARHERRTAIIGRELARHNIDIAALSETRLAGESCREEVGAGYTFFWIGKPEEEHRQAGVGFAVRSSIAATLGNHPKGVNERLMTLRIPLAHHRYATLISAYAPTMTAPDELKEQFYEDLNTIIRATQERISFSSWMISMPV